MKSASILLLTSLFILSGCCEKKQPTTLPGQQPEGFALLYNVSSQEQDVDKLLWIKTPGKEIADWVKEIAAFNKAVTTQLEAWKQDGSVTNLKNLSLPPAEVKARAQASSETTGELLFETDADLRVIMVYSQLQSLGYCSDLCHAIANLPYGKAHADTLENWKNRYQELQNDGFMMLKTGTVSGQPVLQKDEDKSPPTVKSNTNISHGPSQN